MVFRSKPSIFKLPPLFCFFVQFVQINEVYFQYVLYVQYIEYTQINKLKKKGIANRRVFEWNMYAGVKPESDGLMEFLKGSVAKAEDLIR